MKNIFNERPLLKLGLKSASLMAASYGLMYSSWFCAQKINKKEIKEDWKFWGLVVTGFGLIIPYVYLQNKGENILHNIIEKKPIVNRFFLPISTFFVPLYFIFNRNNKTKITLIAGDDKHIINIPTDGTYSLNFKNFKSLKYDENGELILK